MLPESHVDQLVSRPSALTEDVRWTPQKSNPRWVQFAVFLDAPTDTSLRLAMTVNTRNPGFYAILLLRGDQVLRRLDVRGSHRNPPAASGEKWLAATHKHRWTDSFADKVAYTAADISTPPTFDRSEYEGTFRAFCNECNITFSGAWQDPPEEVQQELDL
jgi:hypothetical protein